MNIFFAQLKTACESIDAGRDYRFMPTQTLCDFANKIGKTLPHTGALRMEANRAALAGAARLASILNALPPGENFHLPTLRKIVGGKFVELSRDLDYLETELKLPLERTRRGVILTKQIKICQHCARKAAT